jgi:hypothetical protein
MDEDMISWTTSRGVSFAKRSANAICEDGCSLFRGESEYNR